jgi:glycosyltransferase involved in cell wall biosynthesis
MKVWLIQPGIAPYRIPLFTRLAQTPGIDLTVVLACEQVPGQSWKIQTSQLPFPTELMSGIPCFNWYRGVGRERQVQFAFPLFWKLLIRRPDVVICSGFTLPTLLTLLAHRLTKVPYIIWNEGTEHTDSNISGIKRFLRRRMAASARAFITAGTLSKSYIERLLQHPERAQFFLSYNAVDNSNFMIDTTDSVIHDRCKRLRLSLAPRNLLFVGRLIELKGIRELMAAYRDLVQKHHMSDLGLVLLGVGNLNSYVREYSTNHGLDHVVLAGQISQDEINLYYAVADVFVLLSHYDANPLVLFEALGSGIPIVCSYRAGNAADFIRDGENGYIVDPFDHAEVVERLRMALEDINRDHARATSRELVAAANYDDAARAFVEAIHHAVA